MAASASSLGAAPSSAGRCSTVTRRRAWTPSIASSAGSAPGSGTAPPSGSRCGAASCTSSTWRCAMRRGPTSGVWRSPRTSPRSARWRASSGSCPGARRRPMPECAASITPDSKLGALLERWPELEDVLLELSPQFKAVIESGEHPMPRVMADLAALADGEVYALVTPFVPAPLVDLACGKGFLSFSATEGDAQVRTYFRRRDG